jgi:cysteine-rich repeat protein
MRTRTRLVLGLALAVVASTPASAAFHEIRVKEIFAGSAAHPNAQYVLLQAYSSNQNTVTGHSVLTFDAAGAPTGTFTFAGSVGNDANQMMILVATPGAATIFNLTADLAMTPVLSPAGGKVCWEGSTPDDCVAWGDYTGSATGVGTPYNEDVGLIPGYAARRRPDICLAIENLDACDDTDDGENDFITVNPQPINNMLDIGTTPPATCGNGTLEGLEGCDDDNTTDGDGCSAICHPEPGLLVPASLLVDVTANVPGTSDVNGVFEPGESVRIEPAWKNEDSVDVGMSAQIATFMGLWTASPPFPSYMISDGAAHYGALLPSETKPCDADSDCYRVFADAINRPAQHWDATVDEILGNFGVKTWTLHLGNSFFDVPTSHGFYAFIETILHNSITAGCGGGNYCPDMPVTRAQLAVLLLTGVHGPDYLPPACTGIFDDVDCPNAFAVDWIEQLFAEGITGGCGPAIYCPDAPVQRDQMAVSVLKAKHGSAYVPPVCTGVFDDVDCPNAFAVDFIEQLFAEGITGGCGGGNYCPAAPTTRGQMAVFLVTTFLLKLYGP